MVLIHDGLHHASPYLMDEPRTRIKRTFDNFERRIERALKEGKEAHDLLSPVENELSHIKLLLGDEIPLFDLHGDGTDMTDFGDSDLGMRVINVG